MAPNKAVLIRKVEIRFASNIYPIYQIEYTISDFALNNNTKDTRKTNIQKTC